MNSVTEFLPTEKLYRGAKKWTSYPRFWKKPYDGKNTKLSTAAFKTAKGLSVERECSRSLDEIVTHMKRYLPEDHIISVTVDQCKEAKVLVKYTPSQNNKYHCDILRSETEIILSDEQAEELAQAAVFEYENIEILEK